MIKPGRQERWKAQPRAEAVEPEERQGEDHAKVQQRLVYLNPGESNEMMQCAVSRGEIAAIKNPPATKHLGEPAGNTVEIMVNQAICRTNHEPAGNSNRDEKIESTGRRGDCVNLFRHFLADVKGDLVPEPVQCTKCRNMR